MHYQFKQDLAMAYFDGCSKKTASRLLAREINLTPGLLDAGSWGKVSEELQQMVYAEGTTVIPAIVSYAYHNGDWKNREYKNWQKFSRSN